MIKTAIAMMVLALVSGCSMATAHRATAGAALMAMACDWGETRRATETNGSGTMEMNPILGPAPHASMVDLYFLATTAAIVGIAELAPRKAQPFLYGAVLAVEAHTIRGNMGANLGPCGLK